MTKAYIHFGSHNHHVPIDGCCESIVITKGINEVEGGKKSNNNHFDYSFGY
jgi:hypothetical protein